MGEGYDVEMDNLVSAGDEFIDLADGAQEASAEFSGTMEIHNGVNKGFLTTGKIHSLAHHWEFQVEDLAKRLAMAGGLLQEASDDYQQMEDTVIEALPSPSSEN